MRTWERSVLFMPPIWILSFYIYFGLTALQLGHQPTPIVDDPKNLSTWPGHPLLWMALLFFIFLYSLRALKFAKKLFPNPVGPAFLSLAFLYWIAFIWLTERPIAGHFYLFTVSHLFMYLIVIFKRSLPWSTLAPDVMATLFFLYVSTDPFQHIEWFLD